MYVYIYHIYERHINIIYKTKELHLEYISLKTSYKAIIKRETIQFKKGGKDLNRDFTEVAIKWPIST